ncbi:hypothetical protein HUU51_01845 [Candidatus Gracilibacteria bacterium]|nr:hypothetical protein [Candidatus Gracilibacteria bacterium]
MKKQIFSFLKFIFLVLFFQSSFVFAATNTWDFNNPGDYTLSNTNSFDFYTSSIELKQNTLTHQGRINNATIYNGAYDIVVDGDYAYMTSFLGDRVTILDISNPTAPVFVSQILNNGGTIRLDGAAGIVKDGNYLYVASNVSDALQIIDVTNPASPLAVGQVLNTTTTRLNGARGIYKVGDYVYIASNVDDSLTVINVNNPNTPTYTGKYYVANGNLNGARDVKVVGNYAYVATYDRDSLAVIDISNPVNPTFVTELRQTTRLNGAHHVEISGNYAYVSAYLNASVMVIDISNPLTPVEVTNITGGNYSLTNPRDLIVDGNKLFITSYGNDAVNVVDITDPTTPVYITKILHNAAAQLLDGANGIFKVGNYLYISSYISDALEIIRFDYDATNPFVVSNNGIYFEEDITSISHILTPTTTGDITYQISNNNGTTWYYFNGTSWVTTTGGVANSNSISVINTNLSSLNTLFGGVGVFRFKAFFVSNGQEQVGIDSLSLQTSSNQFIFGFNGRYYIGTAGSPFVESNLRLIRNDTSINFNWGTGIPHPNLPADGFTARWTGKITTDITGTHTFRTNSDDGVRLYINGTLVINGWVDQAPTYRTGTFSLTAGNYYDIVLEYYENGGGAVMQFDWMRPGDTAYSFVSGDYIINNTSYTTPSDISLSNNTVFHLDGVGTSVGDFTSIDLNPGKTFTYSLISGIGSEDNSSFYITGNTLYLNEIADSFSQDVYSIRVRTDDGEGGLYEKVFSMFVVNLSTLNPGFCSSYYNGVLAPPFSPSLLLYKTSTNSVNFNWGTLSPDSSVPADYFTSSYEGYIQTSTTGIHTFRTNSDDGVRLYIDGNLIIDNWTNHGPTYDYGNYTLTAGTSYNIRLEFYENTGRALIQLDWLRPGDTVYSNITQSNVGHVGNCVTTDNIAPVFTYSTPVIDSALIPGKDLNITLNYNDGIDGTGIDLSTGNFSLFRWNGTSWGSDISPTYLSSSSINSLNSNFSLVGLPYGRYNYIFTIDDNNGNTGTISKIFYMDEPSFNVSTSNYNSNVGTTYGIDEIIITVRTVGAAYNLELLKDSNLIDSRGNIIINWDGNTGVGYDNSPYSGPKKDITTNPVVATRASLINTAGELNIYTHRLKIKSLVGEEQAAGNYTMNISFRTIFNY